MKNEIAENNGNQYFQENNYYNTNIIQNKVDDCVESIQKVAKFSWAIVATVIGIIADIITIAVGWK